MAKPFYSNIDSTGLQRLAMAENGYIRLSGDGKQQTGTGEYIGVLVINDITFGSKSRSHSGSAPQEGEVWPAGFYAFPLENVHIESGLCYIARKK